MNLVRPPVDHRVDRPDVEALQGVELTGTNRPRACLSHTRRVAYVLLRVFASTVWLPATTPLTPGHVPGLGRGTEPPPPVDHPAAGPTRVDRPGWRLGGVDNTMYDNRRPRRVSVAMAEGKHPVPYRTR